MIIRDESWQNTHMSLGARAQPMSFTPENFTRSLADPTRLRILILLLERELCVCELTQALSLPQPKISRHLGVLRESGLLLDRRSGLWIHYRIHPDLPAWAKDALGSLAQGCAGRQPFIRDRSRLSSLSPSLTGTCG